MNKRRSLTKRNKEPTEILELKNLMNEIKNALVSIICRLDQAEESD